MKNLIKKIFVVTAVLFSLSMTGCVSYQSYNENGQIQMEITPERSTCTATGAQGRNCPTQMIIQQNKITRGSTSNIQQQAEERAKQQFCLANPNHADC